MKMQGTMTAMALIAALGMSGQALAADEYGKTPAPAAGAPRGRFFGMNTEYVYPVRKDRPTEETTGYYYPGDNSTREYRY